MPDFMIIDKNKSKLLRSKVTNKYTPKLIIKNIKKKPKISLCIPTVNRNNEFLRLLNSFKIDLNENIEIVICDDNKEDISLKNFKKYNKNQKISIPVLQRQTFRGRYNQFISIK